MGNLLVIHSERVHLSSGVTSIHNRHLQRDASVPAMTTDIHEGLT
jgi:hypothetical protein